MMRISQVNLIGFGRRLTGMDGQVGDLMQRLDGLQAYLNQLTPPYGSGMDLSGSSDAVETEDQADDVLADSGSDSVVDSELGTQQGQPEVSCR